MLFKHQEHSAALIARISSSNIVEKRRKNIHCIFYECQKISHNGSGKIAAVNEPQEDEHSSNVISIDQSYLSFKNTCNYLEKIMEKFNGGASMS